MSESENSSINISLETNDSLSTLTSQNNPEAPNPRHIGALEYLIIISSEIRDFLVTCTIGTFSDIIGQISSLAPLYAIDLHIKRRASSVLPNSKNCIIQHRIGELRR